MLKFQGKVHTVLPLLILGTRGFQKRQVVLLDESTPYVQHIPFDFLRDDTALLDDVKQGDFLDISYQLTGREWQPDPSVEAKYFVGCEVTAMTNLTQAEDALIADSETKEQDKKEVAESDDVPF